MTLATIDRRLRELGLTLPPPPSSAGSYLPFVREGRLVQLAGVAPVEDGVYAAVGKVGRDFTTEAAQRAASLCALNLLANLKVACGGNLDRVRRVMMVRGFVNATEDFEEVPLVMNGASDLIIDVFGPNVGRHARTSVGCATLPSGVAVEIDAVVIIDDENLLEDAQTPAAEIHDGA